MTVINMMERYQSSFPRAISNGFSGSLIWHGYKPARIVSACYFVLFKLDIMKWNWKQQVPRKYPRDSIAEDFMDVKETGNPQREKGEQEGHLRNWKQQVPRKYPRDSISEDFMSVKQT